MKYKLEQNKRVDLQIMELRPDLSRTTIKKLLKEGVITIDGNPIRPNYKPQKHDHVEIPTNQIREYLDTTKTFKIKSWKKSLDIIFEDENIIVVNKPTGVSSHPETQRDGRSVLNAIMWHVSKGKDDEFSDRIRLVHRLDKGTSGILLATKNLEAHDWFTKQFEDRDAKKEYIAIVHGDVARNMKNPEEEYIYAQTYIGQDPKDKRKQKNTDNKRGKVAITEIYFEGHFHKFGKYKFSKVRAIPLTGRQHQIRVHLNGYNHPILGDTLYGGQKYKRLMLHAYKLKIRLMNKKYHEFVCEPEERFNDIVNKNSREQIEEIF